jgi:uncharacterized membrane protein YphA (DoxX/SURF4 family)
MKVKNLLTIVLRLAAAIILLQTLYFKFTAQPESVILFTKLGVEPWGRIGTGIIELIAGILLIYGPTSILGAILGVGLMGGAIASHLFVIGIASQGDGGQLFTLAIIVMICCLLIIMLNKEKLIVLINTIKGKSKS